MSRFFQDVCSVRNKRLNSVLGTHRTTSGTGRKAAQYPIEVQRNAVDESEVGFSL